MILLSSLDLEEYKLGVEELESRANVLMELLRQLLHGEIYEFSSAKSSDVPEEPGVYLIREKKDGGLTVVYVGRTRNLRRRILTNHRSGNRRASIFRRKLSKHRYLKNEKEISEYIRAKCYFQFLVLKEEGERNSLEHFAISLLNPELND